MRIVLVVLVVAVSLLASCGPCADCGPCGIQGGPNTVVSLSGNSAGFDRKGALQIELGAGRPSDCGTPNRFWLGLDGTLAPPTSERLDATGLTSVERRGDTRTYTFEGRTIEFSQGRVFDTVKVLVSLNGTTELRRTCTTPDGVTVDCSAQ